MKRFAVLAGWVLLMAYSALCIRIPRIRPRWKTDIRGKSRRFGLLTCVGFAIVWWSPLLAVAGLIPERLLILLYLIMALGIIVMLAGYYLIDVSSPDE